MFGKISIQRLNTAVKLKEQKAGARKTSRNTDNHMKKWRIN